MSSTPSAYAALESATRIHNAAKKRLRWWLAGCAYGVFCLFGRRLLPRDMDPGFIIVLNSWGAEVAIVVCAISAVWAYQEERRSRVRYMSVLRAWSEERAAARRDATAGAGTPPASLPPR